MASPLIVGTARHVGGARRPAHREWKIWPVVERAVDVVNCKRRWGGEARHGADLPQHARPGLLVVDRRIDLQRDPVLSAGSLAAKLGPFRPRPRLALDDVPSHLVAGAGELATAAGPTTRPGAPVRTASARGDATGHPWSSVQRYPALATRSQPGDRY